MNVPFRVGKKEGDESLEKEFLEGASKRGMISLKGHRLVCQTHASSCCSIDDLLASFLVMALLQICFYV